MPTPPAEPRTTPAASTSPSPPPPPSSTPTPAGVMAPPLTVRPQTRSTSTASGAGSPTASDTAGAPLSADPYESSGPTPSASEKPTAPLKLKQRPLAEVFRGLVLGASVAVHQALARSELEQAGGVWLMEEDEAAGVADPLANIAGRRAGGAAVNADVADLIVAGVATVAYLVSNSIAAFQIRRAMRSMARSGLKTDPNTQPEQGEAA